MTTEGEFRHKYLQDLVRMFAKHVNLDEVAREHERFPALINSQKGHSWSTGTIHICTIIIITAHAPTYVYVRTIGDEVENVCTANDIIIIQ